MIDDMMRYHTYETIAIRLQGLRLGEFQSLSWWLWYAT